RIEASGRASSTVQRISLKPCAKSCRAPRCGVAVVLDTPRDTKQVRFHVALQFERLAARSVLQDVARHGRDIERAFGHVDNLEVGLCVIAEPYRVRHSLSHDTGVGT